MRAGTLMVMALVVLAVSACNPKIVREENVYRNEVKFMQATATQQADTLAAFIAANCECKTVDPNGAIGFVTKECLSAAKLVQVVRARVPYHVDMMLYLAGLKEERPPKTPPDVPPPEELCP